MLVHLCSHRVTNTTHLPRSAHPPDRRFGAPRRRRRDRGRRVLPRCRPCRDRGILRGARSGTSGAYQRPGPRAHLRPRGDVAAVEVGGVPIIATFDESPSPRGGGAPPRRAGHRGDAAVHRGGRAVAPQGSADPVGGRLPHRRCRTLDLDPVGGTAGHVVTFSDGPVLDSLVSEMSRWGSTPLVVGARLTPDAVGRAACPRRPPRRARPPASPAGTARSRTHPDVGGRRCPGGRPGFVASRWVRARGRRPRRARGRHRPGRAPRPRRGGHERDPGATGRAGPRAVPGRDRPARGSLPRCGHWAARPRSACGPRTSPRLAGDRLLALYRRLGATAGRSPRWTVRSRASRPPSARTSPSRWWHARR